ncbi:MAG: amidohydrolase family protein [Candidatus Brocadiaceae bacterium]|nr:amidohydrolase family protein [Candidatus Brocadiaceae bacterium]
MRFFDCNCFIGRPLIAMLKPAPAAGDLLSEMDRAGIEKALVWHVVQRDCAVPTGNALLAREIAGHRDRLTGCWAVLPPQTGELPPPEEFCDRMAEAGVRALRAFPDRHHYLLRRESCGPLLDVLVERRIPLFLEARGPGQWQAIYDLMRDFPDLVCVLADMHVWGTDRWFRPLVENYGHVYVEMSEYILDGGVDAFVESYGADRMLFGTGFPKMEHGGVMFMLKHADIADEQKQAIAAGNLERILSEAR